MGLLRSDEAWLALLGDDAALARRERGRARLGLEAMRDGRNLDPDELARVDAVLALPWTPVPPDRRPTGTVADVLVR